MVDTNKVHNLFFFLFGDLKSILIFWDGLQAIQLNGKDTLLSSLSFDLSL